jgi:hypothetical protein
MPRASQRVAILRVSSRVSSLAADRRPGSSLERVTEESDRQTIFNLLAEEQQKQKDAGDPVIVTLDASGLPAISWPSVRLTDAAFFDALALLGDQLFVLTREILNALPSRRATLKPTRIAVSIIVIARFPASIRVASKDDLPALEQLPATLNAA